MRLSLDFSWILPMWNQEKLRYIEIGERKMHLSAVMLGLKVMIFWNKSFFIPLLFWVFQWLPPFWIFNSCVIKFNRSNQFWTYIFFLSYQNQYRRGIFIFLENKIMQTTLWNVYYLSKIRVKKSSTQNNINWLISIQKITVFHAFVPEVDQYM